MKLQKYIAVILAILLVLSMTGCKKDPTEKPDNTKNTATQNKKPTENNESTKNQNDIPIVSPNPTVNNATENTESTGATESISLCDHVPGDNWEVEKSSTCTTEGIRHRTCTLCQEIVETEAIPKQEHDKGSWVVEKASTCSAEGRQSQSCKQCKTKLLIANIAKTAHKPDSTGRACTVCKEPIT